MINLRFVALGWTRPRIRAPQAADLWTWLMIAAHTQLRLARPLAEDLRRPRAETRPAGDFGTSARRPPSRAARPNPADPVRDTRPAPATASPHPATTWEKQCRCSVRINSYAQNPAAWVGEPCLAGAATCPRRAGEVGSGVPGPGVLVNR